MNLSKIYLLKNTFEITFNEEKKNVNETYRKNHKVQIPENLL